MDFLKYVTTDPAAPAVGNITLTTQNITPTQKGSPALGALILAPITHITSVQTTAGGSFTIPLNFAAGTLLFIRNDSGVSVNIFPPYNATTNGQLNGVSTAQALATAKAIMLFALDSTGMNWASINTAQIGA